MKIKHAVMMVSFNQEKYIASALDSILCSEILPDKIIINDDCSTDNTWKIIKEYEKKYPNIIYPQRNEKNIGIYKNINKTWDDAKKSECDIISWCSGDDLWEKDVIKHLNESIEKNNIDIKNEKFIIVTNSILLAKNGKKTIWNNYKLRNSDIALERLGKRLNHREIGLSINVVKSDFFPFDEQLGLASDILLVYSLERNIENWYFENFEAAYYRTRVGIVSTQKVTKLLESEVRTFTYIKEHYPLNKHQKIVTELWISFNTYLTDIKIFNWLKYIKSYFINLLIQPRFLNFRTFICLQPPFILKILLKIKQFLKERSKG